MSTLANLAERVRNGHETAQQLLQQCLARINDPEGEGVRVFRAVSRDTAQATAGAIDQLRAAGVPLPSLAGIPFSVKDVFDVAGEQTLAGSRVLRDREPASRDAPVIARLRSAGAVLVGRTNMTEFAYSGLGVNPHYGTPANPYDRANRRIPGGSSSGAAVSVTDGMAYAGIGSDTGGSCRIPAALCGIVGFKPTQRRIPLQGVEPLSSSYDAIGAMAPTVTCCAALDAVMAGEPVFVPEETPLSRLRLLVVENVLLDDLDAATASAFDAALSALSHAGVVVERRRLSSLALIPDLTTNGGIVSAEAYAHHRRLMEAKWDEFDPRVRVRIESGAKHSAADYLDLQQRRLELCAGVDGESASFDAIVAPTTPMIAPPVADMSDDEAYAKTNRLMLRNPSLANMLDRPSISIPCQTPGEAPVGFMLTGKNGEDRNLFAMTTTVERLLARR